MPLARNTHTDGRPKDRHTCKHAILDKYADKYQQAPASSARCSAQQGRPPLVVALDSVGSWGASGHHFLSPGR